MYSPEITQRTLQTVADDLNTQARAQGRPEWTPEYHSITQIDHAIAHLNDLMDLERHALRRPLTKDEIEFIQNERRICAIDFRTYWLTRYAWLINWEKKAERFRPNIAQNIVMDLWAEDEAVGNAIWMQQLKARRLGMCLEPSTRILTSDLRWIPIDEIKVGQELVGVEEEPRSGRGAGRKMQVATVEVKREVKDHAFEIRLDNGERIIATGLHRFLYQRAGAFALNWKQVRRMRVGDKIKTLCRPWGSPNLEDGWIAGMLDGEGSLGVKSGGAEVNISQRLGPVYDRVVSYMIDRKYSYREEFDLREYKAVHPAAPKTKRKPFGKVCVARMSEMFRLIGQTRPTRFITTPWWTGKELPGKKVSSGWARILSITPVGERRMIDLQTSTKTFIAEGFVSHNSTISELNVTHRFQFEMDANCVVASADPTKTLEMAGMIKFCLDNQPWWLLPGGDWRIKSGIPVSFPEIRTRLTFQAGNQFTGVAQGSTPSVVHLSELCLWQDPEELIDMGLMPAILDTPNVFGILESTAQGPGWWKNKWEQSKREWSQGTGRIRPVFLPWFVGVDIYPTAADLRKRPIKANWVPGDRTVAHAERAREYVLSNPLLFKYLAKGQKDWRLPREQMHWWEMGYEAAKRDKELNVFLAQYCSDDFEAFQSSNIPIIDTEILLGYQERTRPPIGAYTIIGPDIPPALITPRRFWDHDKPTITVQTREIVPKLDVKYQLVPLKFEGYSAFDWDLKLLIWEWPNAGDNYGIGVDTSEGIGQDRAIISVLRESTPRIGPGQVAEWASAYVTAFQLWPLVMAVGCLYSTYKASAAKRLQCRLAIECWANGAACQHELQKRGWHNFHPWKSYDNRKIRKDGEVNKMGVYTNQTFRSQMFDMLLTHLSEESIDLPSPYLINELTTLERAGDRRKPQAAPDAYDDRVMAVGFPLFSLHMGKPPSRQFTRQRVSYVPGSEPEVKPNYAIWQADNQALDLPNQVAMQTRRTYGLRGQIEVARAINRKMPQGYR